MTSLKASPLAWLAISLARIVFCHSGGPVEVITDMLVVIADGEDDNCIDNNGSVNGVTRLCHSIRKIYFR